MTKRFVVLARKHWRTDHTATSKPIYNGSPYLFGFPDTQLSPSSLWQVLASTEMGPVCYFPRAVVFFTRALLVG